MAVLPQRFTELGRIRIGDQVPLKGKNGTRPRRLEAFRLTSTNKPRLEFAATLWGGAVTPWEDAPQGRQWQLYTEQEALPVVVPPFHALSQYNEVWAGNECRLRCDGDHIIACHDAERVGQDCYCAKLSIADRLERAKDGKACQTVTRLSLILPDLPGVGVWRLDTNSYYAGMELQGNSMILEQASAEGALIDCTLQLEQRKVVRRVMDPKTKQSKTQTQVFSVVTLQPNVSMRQLLTRQIPPDALVGGTVLGLPRPQQDRLLDSPAEHAKSREEHIADVFSGEAADYQRVAGPAPEPEPEEEVDPVTGEVLEKGQAWDAEESARLDREAAAKEQGQGEKLF